MTRKQIIYAIVVISIIILIANYQNIYKAFVPPMPVIVSSIADGTSSTILEYSVRVRGEVRNEGGDGYIVIKATVDQGGDSWTKTQQLYLKSLSN